MTQRDDRMLVKDMLQAARSALDAVRGREFSSLAKEPVWTLGLIKCLEIVGEAARSLSADLKRKHSAISWAKIVGMRNRLVHAYFDIDYEQVWRTLTEDLPALVRELETIVGGEPGAPS